MRTREATRVCRRRRSRVGSASPRRRKSPSELGVEHPPSLPPAVLLEHPTAVTDFRDDDEIVAVYYAEMMDVVKKASGSDRVYIFDHTVRAWFLSCSTLFSRHLRPHGAFFVSFLFSLSTSSITRYGA